MPPPEPSPPILRTLAALLRKLAQQRQPTDPPSCAPALRRRVPPDICGKATNGIAEKIAKTT
jgi:hypothetical protein